MTHVMQLHLHTADPSRDIQKMYLNNTTKDKHDNCPTSAKRGHVYVWPGLNLVRKAQQQHLKVTYPCHAAGWFALLQGPQWWSGARCGTSACRSSSPSASTCMSPLEACKGWGSLASNLRDTCNAMDLTLLSEKRCSRMGLSIACRWKTGMRKATGEWQKTEQRGKQKDLQKDG